MKTRNFKPLWALLIVVCSLLLSAVAIGVLNGTVGKGKWRIGWLTYSYEDEASYTVGSGTVFEKGISALEITWETGEVEVLLSEDDSYLSLTESTVTGEELSEKNCLRWRVEADGTLRIQWRESGTYLASSVPEKKLTVRIPAAMMAGMREAELETVLADVTIERVSVPRLSVETVSGNVLLSGGRVDELDVESTGGAVTLLLPQDASFALTYETAGGRLLSDFALTPNGTRQICGSGKLQFEISTGGDVSIKKRD